MGFMGLISFTKSFDRLGHELGAASASDLEKNTFKQFLTSYDSKFASMMDNVSKSFFGAGADEVTGSAGAGIVQALSNDSYVFRGGNSGLAKKLSENLEHSGSGRLKTSAFVWRVEKNSTGGVCCL